MQTMQWPDVYNIEFNQMKQVDYDYLVSIGNIVEQWNCKIKFSEHKLQY